MALALSSSIASAQEGSRVKFQTSNSRADDLMHDHFDVTISPKKTTTVVRSSSQVITETPTVAKVVTPEPAPEPEAVAAVEPVPEPAPEPAPAPAPKELPTTASPYPGIALTGLGAFLAAFTMSRLRRRFSCESYEI
jgi:hypothetical protein